jgi:hypothetical protein
MWLEHGSIIAQGAQHFTIESEICFVLALKFGTSCHQGTLSQTLRNSETQLLMLSMM